MEDLKMELYKAYLEDFCSEWGESRISRAQTFEEFCKEVETMCGGWEAYAEI